MTMAGKPVTGTTKRLHHNRSSPEEKNENSAELIPKNRRRRANVYDAVAGRVSTNGFIPLIPHRSTYRDTLSSNLNPINPEEVLFRMKGATPDLFHEEVYFANESVLSHQLLPDSDLLKAIHTYAADYYTSATVNGGSSDWRSLDETALMAMGILLEEVARESLGESGDLVFVEGEGGQTFTEISAAGRNGLKRSNTAQSGTYHGIASSEQEVRARKRRRLSTDNVDISAQAG